MHRRKNLCPQSPSMYLGQYLPCVSHRHNLIILGKFIELQVQPVDMNVSDLVLLFRCSIELPAGTIYKKKK